MGFKVGNKPLTQVILISQSQTGGLMLSELGKRVAQS